MRSTDSGFNEDVYLAAAQEHVTTANLLLQQTPPQFVMACYTAGVAVECMMHAYRLRAGAVDTAKHDLRLHAEIGDFFGGMSRKQREAVAALLSTVVARWQNNHRYRSEKAMRAFITSKRLFTVRDQTTIRGDALVYHTEVLVEAAIGLVTIGVDRWNNSSNI